MSESSSGKRAIRVIAVATGVVLAAALIAGWLSGIDLASTFFGTASPYEYSRGMMAVKGIVITIAIFVGGLFLASLMALASKR